MPWATFTEPEVAHVGPTEAATQRRHGNMVRVHTQLPVGVERAAGENETAGFLKLISTSRGELLRAEIVGPYAGEYINQLALVLSGTSR